MITKPRYRIFKADASDELRLKNLFSEKSRDGSVQINLDRSPEFFESLRVEGFENAVYAVEDTQTGLLAGAGIRSIRQCFVNGKIQNTGYLSGLRVGKVFRKSRVMAMVFNMLRQLYLKGECSGYLYSVFNSNKTAIQLLTSGKAGMPIFKKVGQLNTFVFKPLSITSKKDQNVIVRQVQNTDIAEMVNFLNSEGSGRQYFPYYSYLDFESPSGLLKNLQVSDICIAIKNNEIVGCLALWDQTAFRRWKVEGYSQVLSVLRPLINAVLHLFCLPLMPGKQANFNYRILSLVCIKNNNRDIFAALYNMAIKNIPKKENILISGSFFKNDPLIQALPVFKMSFKSTIFIGFWKETQKEIELIDNRFPYIEAGSL